MIPPSTGGFSAPSHGCEGAVTSPLKGATITKERLLLNGNVRSLTSVRDAYGGFLTCVRN